MFKLKETPNRCTIYHLTSAFLEADEDTADVEVVFGRYLIETGIWKPVYGYLSIYPIFDRADLIRIRNGSEYPNILERYKVVRKRGRMSRRVYKREGAEKRSIKSYRLDIPEGITHLEPAQFRDEERLCEVYLPSTLIEIPAACFMGCRFLHKVKMQEGLYSIEAVAFSGCPIEEVKIPDSVKYVGPGAFTRKLDKRMENPGEEWRGYSSFWDGDKKRTPDASGALP